MYLTLFYLVLKGKLEAKDFEIAKEAGAVDRAITRNFNFTVTDNYLEIQLFWAGKGTCCIPITGHYGPIISAIKVVPGNNKHCLLHLIFYC